MVKLSWTTKADWSYAFQYFAGPHATNYLEESYALRTWSNVSYSMKIWVKNFYQGQATVTLGLFDITPYNQTLRWYELSRAIWDLIDTNTNNFNF
jgi:hypothetical protein